MTYWRCLDISDDGVMDAVGDGYDDAHVEDARWGV